jgi:hypothetical protein
MRVTERLAPVAAAMSALATLACCLPLGIAGAMGALGLSVVALESLRPWLIGLAVILLGVSCLQIYRGPKDLPASEPSEFDSIWTVGGGGPRCDNPSATSRRVVAVL